MSETPSWRAGFELEVILGDLGEPRFERELREGEAMDLSLIHISEPTRPY